MKPSRRPALAIVSTILLAAPAFAAQYYWDGNPDLAPIDSASQGGAGLWSTAMANWDDGVSHVVWSAGNTANFGGTAGTVTLDSAITASGVNVATGGYSIGTGGNALTLAGPVVTSNAGGTTTLSGVISATATQTWSVAAGGTLQVDAAFASPTPAVQFQLNSAGTTNVTGSFSVAGKATLSSGGTGGTINLSGTESFETSAGDYSGIANVTVNNTAGTASFSPGAANSFFIGNTGDALKPSTLNVTGGTVQITSNTRIFIGDGFNGTLTTAGDGILTVGGGAGPAIFTAGTTTSGTAASLGNNASTGTINLLSNGVIALNRSIAAGAATKGTFNFDGGTLRATGTAINLAGNLIVTVKEGGAFIDAQGFAVTLAAPFTQGGVAAVDGGITVNGTTGSVALSGILSHTGGLVFNTAGGTLSGNNSYTGLTQINKFVDGRNSGNLLGATGAGNGTSINAGGTLRFRDTGNATIPEAIVFNGGGFRTYNSGGTTTLSGPLTLAANTTLDIQPEVQASTTVVLSGGIGETGGPRNLTIARSDAAPAASNDVANITGAATYTGATTFTDALSTATGSFSVKLSGGNDRLPAGTTVTLGGTGANSRIRLVVGDAATGAVGQTLAGLLATGSGTKSVLGGAPAVSTLTLNIPAGSDDFTGTLGGTGANDNNLALAKSGPGTLVLSGANTYLGGTTVAAGVLAVNGASLADGGKLVISGGKVDASNVETVDTLFFGAAQQASGSWGSSDSGAEHQDNTRFSGAGIVFVTTAPVAGYASYAAANGIPGEPATGDFDKDGLANVVEYALGLDPAKSSVPPGTFSGGQLTFTKGSAALASGDVTYAIEQSTALSGWVVVVPDAPASPTISYTLPAGQPKQFARLRVTLNP